MVYTYIAVINLFGNIVIPYWRTTCAYAVCTDRDSFGQTTVTAGISVAKGTPPPSRLTVVPPVVCVFENESKETIYIKTSYARTYIIVRNHGWIHSLASSGEWICFHLVKRVVKWRKWWNHVSIMNAFEKRRKLIRLIVTNVGTLLRIIMCNIQYIYICVVLCKTICALPTRWKRFIVRRPIIANYVRQ